MEMICSFCKKTFKDVKSRLKVRSHCSRACKLKNKKPLAKRICKACERPFEVPSYQLKYGRGIYCSRECVPPLPKNTKQTGTHKKCLMCDIVIYAHPYQIEKRKFCSKDCHNEAKRKKLFRDSPTFKNGKSFFARIAVETRDDPCSICSGMGRNRQLHHIDGNDMNNQRSNLISLCGSCHTRIHVLNRQSLFSLPEALEHFKTQELWKLLKLEFRSYWTDLKASRSSCTVLPESPE